MTAALALALLLAGPLDWVVWAQGHDFAASLTFQADPSTVSVQIKRCDSPRGCPSLTINVQASRPGRPGSICAWSTLPIRDRVVFVDGFESGDVSRWAHAPPPDGITRLLVPWSNCAGQIVRIRSEAAGPRPELVLLDIACVGASILQHGGEVTITLKGRTWAARLPAGLLKFGTLETSS